MNPSPPTSPVNEIEILALAGKAMKSMRVKPAKLPAECFPCPFNFPELW
jgi:hypothetical protein